MTVKEIIEKSAELLGVELTDENTETFVRCYNLIETELSIDYFPLRTIDKVLIKDNKIKYTELKNKPSGILSVRDFQNEEVKYTIYIEYLELKKNYNGHYFFVRYNYIPEEKTVDENCDYDCRYEQVFKYGICGEYCLMQGDYETASAFNEKYKKAILERYAKRKRSDNGD